MNECTWKANVLCLVVRIKQTSEQSLALARFARAIKALDNNEGATTGLCHYFLLKRDLNVVVGDGDKV